MSTSSEKDGNVTVKKLIKVILGFLVGVGVIVGSYKIMEVVQKNEMNHIVKSEEVKEIVENYLKYLDADALTDKGKIVSYQIDEASIEHNPMGGIMFTVLLNGDSDLYVRMTLEKNNETGKYNSLAVAMPKRSKI